MRIHYCGWDKSCQHSQRVLGGPKNRRLHLDTPWFHTFIDLVDWRDRDFTRRRR